MTQEPQPNTLGKTSLILGIVASSAVFSLGLCAGVGQQQGWLKNVVAPFGVCGGTFTFLGFLAAVLGFGGLFGRNRSRATAIVGLVLGMVTVLMFAAIVQNAKR